MRSGFTKVRGEARQMYTGRPAPGYLWIQIATALLRMSGRASGPSAGPRRDPKRGPSLRPSRGLLSGGHSGASAGLENAESLFAGLHRWSWRTGSVRHRRDLGCVVTTALRFFIKFIHCIVVHAASTASVSASLYLLYTWQSR